MSINGLSNTGDSHAVFYEAIRQCEAGDLGLALTKIQQLPSFDDCRVVGLGHIALLYAEKGDVKSAIDVIKEIPRFDKFGRQAVFAGNVLSVVSSKCSEDEKEAVIANVSRQMEVAGIVQVLYEGFRKAP